MIRGRVYDADTNNPERFPVKMVVYTTDRPGVLTELTSVLSNENSNILSLEARTSD